MQYVTVFSFSLNWEEAAKEKSFVPLREKDN